MTLRILSHLKLSLTDNILPITRAFRSDSMLTRFRPPHVHHGVTPLAILALSTLLFGCTGLQTQNQPVGRSSATSKKAAPTPMAVAAPAQITESRTTANAAAVVRYGRYTLVELTSGQGDLMQQIVDTTIPADLPATVGETLRYVLERSGYRLCQGDDETNALNALPLPAAHLHLGPLPLREALQILIGPARELTVDEMTREVCVRPHALPTPANNTSTSHP